MCVALIRTSCYASPTPGVRVAALAAQSAAVQAASAAGVPILLISHASITLARGGLV